MASRVDRTEQESIAIGEQLAKKGKLCGRQVALLMSALTSQQSNIKEIGKKIFEDILSGRQGEHGKEIDEKLKELKGRVIEKPKWLAGSLGRDIFAICMRLFKQKR